MTLIYARIANRIVADEYQAISAQIDALYGQLPASLRRFAGTSAYDTTALRSDLARFQFLLGGDEQPFLGTDA